MTDTKKDKEFQWISKADLKVMGYDLNELGFHVLNVDRPDAGQAREAKLLAMAQRLFDFVDQIVLAFGERAGNSATPKYLFECAQALNSVCSRKKIHILDITKIIEQHEESETDKKAHNLLQGRVDNLLDALSSSNENLQTALKELQEVARDRQMLELAIRGLDSSVKAEMDEG